MQPILEELTGAESLRLTEQADIGRIGFSGSYGPKRFVRINRTAISGRRRIRHG
jgi:hypothetical protein